MPPDSPPAWQDDPEYASQTAVWEDIGVGVLNNAFEGYNCSLFACEWPWGACGRACEEGGDGEGHAFEGFALCLWGAACRVCPLGTRSSLTNVCLRARYTCADGQTGAGKSYSMVGYGVDRGIIPIACEHIFERIKTNTDPDLTIKVTCSML
jgi:hypothetical protein